jgi:hypothetical protein
MEFWAAWRRGWRLGSSLDLHASFFKQPRLLQDICFAHLTFFTNPLAVQMFLPRAVLRALKPRNPESQRLWSFLREAKFT